LRSLLHNKSFSKMDQKIRGLVSILNSCGIPTTGSCEGHIDHGSPAPWVKVTPANGSKTKNRHVLRNTVRYLNAFYLHRNASRDVHLAIKKAHSGFWIHNGGAGYNRWRTFVNESAATIRGGGRVRAYIDSKERTRRSKTLSIYQKEVKAFAGFLKRRILRA
jgi:hypothetical protein